MIIGIEGQRLFRKKKHGMDMVALELIRNLQLNDSENQYVLFIKPDEDDQLIKENANFRIVRLKGGFYPFWEQLALPMAAKKAGCQLLHCTSNTAPVFSSIPLIVTLHDIIYMESSYLKIIRGTGSWYQKLGNAYRKLFVPLVIKRSSRIITVSDFEKERIGQYFGIADSKRLSAVYNGVSEHFKPVTDDNELIRISKKYDLPDRYFFFLGNTDPKKNTRGMLKAYSDFLIQTRSDIKLVMLDYEQGELNKLLDDIGDRDLISRIKLTGYVVNTDLPSIYCLSEAFIYPSLRESFGIPMLEAMACGTPVITSNTSSMPEVAGDAALFTDPYKPEEITEAMIRITNDQQLRSELIKKGFVQAAKFSWKAMALKVMEIYREIGSQNNN
ncbi:MAG TPA: glycosyltransferase family 1 protein [Prolixibacteraceae bacterium]|nr:glycosyltransferase family 1 protein [Prolixibacteraceae bacterium]